MIYSRGIQRSTLAVALLGLALCGCIKTDIVDYSLPQAVKEKNAFMAQKNDTIRAIYDIERVLVTKSLDVTEPTDMTPREIVKRRRNNFDLEIGYAAKIILQEKLEEGLRYTLLLTVGGKSYTTKSIMYCGEYTLGSFDAFEDAIRSFVCDKNSSVPHVNLANLDPILLEKTIPIKTNDALSVTTSSLHPYENIQWYLLTEDGITPVATKNDKIFMPTLQSASIIFAVVKAEHDSLLKQFMWILTPASKT